MMMLLSTMLYYKVFDMSETMDIIANVFSATILMILGIGATFYNISKLYFSKSNKFKLIKLKWNTIFNIKMVILCILFMSCSDSKMETDCREKTLNEVKRIFPNSKVIYYNNYRGYNYIVSDTINVMKVSCSCLNNGSTVIFHIEVLEQK